MFFKKLLVCAVLSFAAATFVNAQSAPRDVRDLVGARASSGETQLAKRGYKFVKTEEGDDRKWSNYWKKSTNTCITVTTMNGRYNAIMKTPSADCSSGNTGSGSTDKLDVSDLVGARASSGESQLTQRGYRFIKTEKGDDRNWSNWWNQTTGVCITVATVNGRYDSITKTPAADCSGSGSSNNGGGNGGGATAKVDVSDLVGARASSGEMDLKNRGFRLVDTTKMANTSYTIWWRQPSRQCVQVATANGRYDSVTDIQTHPMCK